MGSVRSDAVVDSFGDEWSRFRQQGIEPDLMVMFTSYFRIFPWTNLPSNAIGFDLGCGSGRWAKFVATRCKELYCIEPSRAIEIAKANIGAQNNVRFIKSNVEDLSLPESHFDFGYCLGVLHHTEEVQNGLNKAVSFLKPGAPFLLYLYYRFDDRPFWFRSLWRLTDSLRKVISSLPFVLKSLVCDVIAFLVYLPFARLCKIVQRLGGDPTNFLLHIYRHRSLYVMRSDALDRFGTKVEKRFTRPEIQRMMEAAGLVNLQFSDQEPYWCAVGYKI